MNNLMEDKNMHQCRGCLTFTTLYSQETPVCVHHTMGTERVKEETSSRTQNTKLVIITNDAMPKSDKVVRVSGVGY